MRRWLMVMDRAGPWLASLCAVHCLAVPLALAMTASMTISLLSWKHPHHGWATFLLGLGRWEVWLMSSGVGVTALTLAHGFSRHRGQLPALWLTVSVAFYLLGRSTMWAVDLWTHAGLTLTGSLFLIAATLHDRLLRRGRDATTA